MRHADVWVHYNDVQFSKGSFTNRVQIKTNDSMQWLTVPILKPTLGTDIKDCPTLQPELWKAKLQRTLTQAYNRAPHRDLVLELSEMVFSRTYSCIGDLSSASMTAVRKTIGIASHCEFLYSSDLGIVGSGSDRVLRIVKHLGRDRYITGHGARKYLEHEKFEEAGIRVEYVDYHITEYPQLHGDFTPYVSSLDAIANCGDRAHLHMESKLKPWRDFLAGNP